MKKQRILILAITASMIKQFNMHNIDILRSLGAEVYVGTNFYSPGTITNDSSNKLRSELQEKGVKCFQIDFKRGIGTHKSNKQALKEICNIISSEKITGIHAHSPLGGIIGRRAAHKKNIKIIYTAHGFQFFRGGPIKNWIIFFPVEWFYGRWTDALITINKQDFKISKKIPAKNKYYIPGIGIDISQDVNYSETRKKARQKLGLNKDDYLIISVGELNKNKNHLTVLRAISRLNNPKIKYMIAGIGPERKELLRLSEKLKLGKNFKLLGYLENLQDLYCAADLNVFISKREGLGLAGLDGIKYGLYIIGSKRTGMKDYITSDKIGLLVDSPTNVDEVASMIYKALKGSRRISDKSILKKFSYTNVDKKMKFIYKKEFFS